ncbi:MAG TPA: IPExxxVDY family protein [Bacteroidales bacterium]|nr:IPExxxVDY family protein [Bacteroidales bacterium]
MKSIQKITRIQLEVNKNDESFLIGIVSAEPDYKLSLTLNKKFSISLKSIIPLQIPENNGSELTFSRFSDLNDSPDIIYNLISNRSGKSFLLKKLKNVDYILQVLEHFNDDNVNRVITILREIDTITAVFNIDLNKIKDKNIQYLIQ